MIKTKEMIRKILVGVIYRVKHIFYYFWRRPIYARYHYSDSIGTPLLITPKYIELDKNVSIWSNARIEGVSKYNEKRFTPRIIFHDGVSIQQNIHLTCAKKIEIGKNTAIAANVTITDIHHPYEDISIPIEKQDIEVNPVTIGDDCKIYNNSVILPGTTIGKHCTVGANSVVSGKFPDYCVIVGAPARIVKRYDFSQRQWRDTSVKDCDNEK
jgi:acetyltransferase-like isoleucine patch superfamily enzyme